MNNDVHVVPNGSNGWKVTQNGKTLKATDTQAEAIEFGRKIAKRDESELVIKGKDGKIRDKNSHGNDPFPPRG